MTTYAYDTQDHLTAVIDGEGSTTTYVYSDRDLMTSQVSLVSGTTSHTYNPHGELVESTDARAVVTTRVVNAADRVERVVYSDGSAATSYSYGTNAGQHDLGRLIGTTSGDVDLVFAYDAFGRMRQDGDLAFTYDANGNVETLTYPDGLTASYAHDAMDRHASLSVQEPGGPATPVVSASTAATYRAFGPLAALTFGTAPAVGESRSYDARYSPLTLAVSSSLLSWVYSTDAAGNLTAIDDTTAANEDRTFAYQEWQQYLTLASGPGQARWVYDRIGNRMRETNLGLGNLYTYVHGPGGGNTALLATAQFGDELPRLMRSYTFDAGGYLSHTSTNFPGIELPVDFGFDGAGTLTALESGGKKLLRFAYDGRGFLARAMIGETPYLVPSYDSQGRLLATLRTNLSVNPTDVTRTSLLYFAGRPVAQWTRVGASTATLTFLVTDHLGTPALALAADATVRWSGGFEPFGRDYRAGTSEGALENGIFLRLPGQWDDPYWRRTPDSDTSLGADLYYSVHRWYEPQTGRYTSTDYLGLLASPNFFSYVDSRPTFYVDPLGLQLSTPIVLPPPGCFCAVNIFLDTYRDMRRANWKYSDRYFHCKANCDATRCGNGGESCACLLSDLREWFDLATGDYPSDSAVDQGANQIGRHRSKANARTACSVNCNTFRPRNLPPEY